MSKNYGIVERKDLEDTIELTGHEGADRWASWPHMSSSGGVFLAVVSNPYLILKSIFSRYEM